MARRLSVLILSVAVVFLLAACAGSPGSSGKPIQVNVTAGDFYFKSSQTTFQKGVPYHFVVKNVGNVEHEFMIVKPMPTSENSDQMDSQAIVHIEEDDLQPGQTATVDYTFTQAYPKGSLEFSCHLTGHYEQGMHLPIEVK